jgi:hypothetical protein
LDERFSQLLWNKIKEKNPKFFEAYQLRIRLRDQILLFNKLVSIQRRRLFEYQSHSYHPQSQELSGGIPLIQESAIKTEDLSSSTDFVPSDVDKFFNFEPKTEISSESNIDEFAPFSFSSPIPSSLRSDSETSQPDLNPFDQPLNFSSHLPFNTSFLGGSMSLNFDDLWKDEDE